MSDKDKKKSDQLSLKEWQDSCNREADKFFGLESEPDALDEAKRIARAKGIKINGRPA